MLRVPASGVSPYPSSERARDIALSIDLQKHGDTASMTVSKEQTHVARARLTRAMCTAAMSEQTDATAGAPIVGSRPAQAGTWPTSGEQQARAAPRIRARAGGERVSWEQPGQGKRAGWRGFERCATSGRGRQASTRKRNAALHGNVAAGVCRYLLADRVLPLFLEQDPVPEEPGPANEQSNHARNRVLTS